MDERQQLERERQQLEARLRAVDERLDELNDVIVGPFGSRAKGKDHLTCRGCGLRSNEVEAGGIYYCPNPLCTMSGAWFHRSKLASYQECENGKHTVDADEMLKVGFKFLREHEPSALTAAVRGMLPYWAKQGSWASVEKWMAAMDETLPEVHESGWGPGPHPCLGSSPGSCECLP